MTTNHVVVWLDHREAHVIAFNRDAAEKPLIVRATNGDEQRHLQAHMIGHGKAAEHPEYFEHILDKIRNVSEWLIVGPANAKLAFAKHIGKHHANLLDHLIGVETVDHPTDGQLLAYAKKYFRAADRMSGGQTLA